MIERAMVKKNMRSKGRSGDRRSQREDGAGRPSDSLRRDATATFEEGTATGDRRYEAPIAWMSGYDGANWSKSRGRIHWPSLDPRLELDSFSRTELLRRVHWLKGNFGFIRGLIRNTAELVGFLVPQGESGDDEWDDEAEEAYNFVTGEAEAFDVAGKFDVEEAQTMLMREALTDGDALTVMTRWDNGAARFMFYKTSQLANPKDANEDWRDGIKVVKGRHVAYGLRTGKKEDAVTVVPASSVIYFGEFDAPGEDRPVPPLSAAVNHSQDITETWGFLKEAVKASSLLGVVRERTAAATPRARQGLTGPPQTVTTPGGDKITLADIWGGGQMPDLEPGVSAKILTDGRPHPNVQEQIHTLMRDVAEGFGLPLEVVWAMIRVTGPGVRFALSRADRWIKQRQKRQRKWARKVWRYVIACEIERGALRMPPMVKGKQRWWAVSFTAQSNLTIDRGQVSRAMCEELDRGVTTYSAFDDIDGRHWKDRARQRIKEVSWMKKECAKEEVEYGEVFRSGSGVSRSPGEENQESRGKGPEGEEEEE